MFNFPQSDCFLPLKIPWEVFWIKGHSATFLFCCVFEADLCISLGNDQGHRATHKGGKTVEHEYLAEWYSMLAFLWIYIGNKADSSQVLDLLFLQAPFPYTCLCTTEGCWRPWRRKSDIIKVCKEPSFHASPFSSKQKGGDLCLSGTFLTSPLPGSVSALSIQASAQFVKYLSLVTIFLPQESPFSTHLVQFNAVLNFISM